MTSAYKKADKGMRSIFSHLDQTSWSIKDFLWPNKNFAFWGLKARNPKWVRQGHLAHSGR